MWALYIETKEQKGDDWDMAEIEPYDVFKYRKEAIDAKKNLHLSVLSRAVIRKEIVTE